MTKKYELTDEVRMTDGVILHRIRALMDFCGVKAGDLGGWIETEDNLSQNGDAWVYGDACVYGSALVYGNAWVYGDARVYGNAQVYGDARVYGDALVYGDARVYGGKWAISPLYIQGSRYACNVASDNEVRIGCQNHTWQEWHDKYLEIAKAHAAEDIVAEYVEYFNLACRLYGHEDCQIRLEGQT